MKKSLFLFLFFLLGNIGLKAQSEDDYKKIEYNLSTGLGRPYLDNGLVLLSDFNAAYRLNNWLAAQAGITYTMAPHLNQFLSGTRKSENTLMPSVGLQFRTSKTKNNLFLSFHSTVGYVWKRIDIDYFGLEQRNYVGVTSWANFHHDTFCFGIGVVHTYFGFRVAHTFK